MSDASAERDLLERSVARYRSAGYEIVEDPHRSQLPGSVQDFVPDFIATRGDEHVAVEVKSRLDFEADQILRRVAEEYRRIPGWRFDLVVGESKQTPSVFAPLELKAMVSRLHSADQLGKKHDYAGAMLLLWTAAEAILRRLLPRAESDRLVTGSRLIKTAYSDGIINERDLRTFERLAVVRNQVVHGARPQERVGARDYAAARRAIARLIEGLSRQRISRS